MYHPVNVIKYCPKCGSDKFLPESNRSFKCGKCGFHFFINSAAATAAVIMNEKGEMLLTRRAENPHKGKLDLPGGFVDPGENAEIAMRREIAEELNLEVVEMKFMGSFPNEYVFSNYTVFTTDIGFLCSVKDFSSITFRDDISGFEFIKPTEIPFDEISSLSIRNIVQLYIDEYLEVSVK